jgi:DNA-directed RNA polymerase specialized sigma subunit
VTVKEYLSQALFLDESINCKLEQVSILKRLATKITSNFEDERVTCTKQQSPMENVIVKLVDLENEINDDIDKLVDLKREIKTAISNVNNDEFRLLLELRYLSNKEWEEIALLMNYSWRNIHYLHNKALKEVKISN